MARQKITFAGSTGESLAAVLETPSQPPAAFVLFAHCFSCGKDVAAASRISRALVARGYAVLRFDFTGLGNSDGDFANTNFSSNVEDLVRAAEFLEHNYLAPALLVGHSLGGTAALVAAAQLPSVRAVATIGAPMTPAHVLKQFSDADLAGIEATGSQEVSLAGRSFTIRQQFLDDAREPRQTVDIGNLRRALLVYHAPLDDTVAISEAEAIYTAARHPKSFITLDGANHLLTDKADAEYVAATLVAWAGRYLGTSVESGTSADTRPAPGSVVVYEQNRKFARRVESDNHTWFADEPEKTGGSDLGPDPYEHLLAALGTCTSMTIRMYANRRNLPLDDVTVTLRHAREYDRDCEGCIDDPRRIEILQRDITLTGDLDESTRARLLEIADRCPVHRTLEADLKISTLSTPLTPAAP